jgi:putative membrane protein
MGTQILRWFGLALALWCATLLVPGIRINGGAWSYLWVALLFGVINAIIGGIVKVLTFPITFLTLGLFVFVVNAMMLSLTARWSDALDVRDFWSAFFACLIISAITAIVNTLTQKSKH